MPAGEPGYDSVPTEIAYDLGWNDGFNAATIRDLHDVPIEEGRAYLNGYRYGEAQRTGDLAYREAVGVLGADPRAVAYVVAVLAAVVVVLTVVVLVAR